MLKKIHIFSIIAVIFLLCIAAISYSASNEEYESSNAVFVCLVEGD